MNKPSEAPSVDDLGIRGDDSEYDARDDVGRRDDDDSLVDDRIAAAEEAMANQQPEPPQSVAPTLLEGLRTAGDKNILPDDVTKTEIQRAGNPQLRVPVKVCLSKTGTITRVEVMKESGFPSYDAKLNREIKKWRYEPYMADGQAVPVCTTFTFVYSQQ